MYKVIKLFTDLQDHDFEYHEGDVFPREGMEVSEERIEELSTSRNRRGVPLIKKMPEKPSPKPEEVPQEVEANESPLKKSKPKKSQKKTQE